MWKRWLNFKEANYLRCLEEVVPVEPVLAIARAHRGRLPMAVASGSTRGHGPSVRWGQIGILDWFECLVAAEDTLRHKPDPDVFLGGGPVASSRTGALLRLRRYRHGHHGPPVEPGWHMSISENSIPPSGKTHPS